jgi:PAS domain S-box-containing protein
MKSNGNDPKRSLRGTTNENMIFDDQFMEMNTNQRVHQTISEDHTREDSDGELTGSQSGDDMKVDGTVASKPKRRAYVDPEVSKERRRERNKLLARKSRQKLKTDMDDLKMKLIYLMKENEYLKRQIEISVVPPVNLQFLVQKDFALPDSITQLVKELMSRTQKALSPRKMKNSSFCISNAISKDMPLVYASPGFLKLTGYEMHEIIGHNCRFLQGARTDRNTVTLIKKALIEGRDITAVLLNYRKDGKPFWNQVKMAHLKDQSGRTFLVVGIQTKIRPLPPQAATIMQQRNRQQQYEVEEEEDSDDDGDDSEDNNRQAGRYRRQQQTPQQQEQKAMEMATTGPPVPSPPPLLLDDHKGCLLDGSFEFSFPPLPCDLRDMIRPAPTASDDSLESQQQRGRGSGSGEEVLDAALVRAFDYYDPRRSQQQQSHHQQAVAAVVSAAVPYLTTMQQQVVQDDHHALLRQSHSYYTNSSSNSSHSSSSHMTAPAAPAATMAMAVGVRRGLGNSSCNDRLLDFNHYSTAVQAPLASPAIAVTQQVQVSEEEDAEFEWGDGQGGDFDRMMMMGEGDEDD